jgi:predicted ABC-type sugar transport system permease subunit
MASVVPKVIVDQFLFSPLFSNPVMVGYFALCAGGFRREAWREVLQTGFYVEKVTPVMVAGWMIWIPGVSVVYSMPQLLQIPVAVIIQCFWVLVFTAIGERHSDRR